MMDDFREALELANLMDLGFKGYPYTWNNCRPGAANTKQRLDRVVSNAAWQDKFPLSMVTHLSTYTSDHIPIILHIKCSGKWQAKGSHGFKFEELWLLWDDCEEVIKAAWEKGNNEATTLGVAKQKITACGVDLLAWGASKTHPNIEEVKRLQKKVKEQNCADYTEGKNAEFLETSKKLDELLHRQEIYWAQRSRIQWLKHGERDTKFFHSKSSHRRKRNYIKRLKDIDNNWVKDIQDITGVATSYFQNMFKAGTCAKMKYCLNAVPYKITIEMHQLLTSDYSAEEIKAALFQMGPMKAPCPNGMNALFYQKFWHIVGDNVIVTVLDFLNSGYMVPEINYTHVVLIPKVKSLEKMVDFRTICLYNVIYKIISKVLANRLKQILPQLISPTQSAFVPSHLITDNVLVAYETLHTMHCGKKGKTSSLALKLDISKAYDRVDGLSSKESCLKWASQLFGLTG